MAEIQGWETAMSPAAADRSSPSILARRIASVFKLRIAVAIAASAVAGFFVAGGQRGGGAQLALLAVAVFAASAAVGAFNQYAERDLDRLMQRTRRRPFASGEWAAHRCWPVGLAVLLAVDVAAAVWGLGAVPALHIFLGAFVYGVVYTLWLKRRTALNIVVGGLSGSFAVLAGAAVVDPVPDLATLILALVLFLWTPPHFWSLALARRDEYDAAGVPMLPVLIGARSSARIIFVHAVALVALSLLLGRYGGGWLSFAAAASGGAVFVAACWRLVGEPTPAQAYRCFYASLAQLTVLLVGVTVEGWLK
jgi:protoheme IX farnesyltransferase